jgi:N-methylhydantoinase B
VPAGATLVLETPGGGGIGPAGERDPEALAADLAGGLVSPEAAADGYGISPSVKQADV